MNNPEKKYRSSVISIVCYVLAAAMLSYVCYTIGNTVHTINDYYAQYGISAQPMEYITYCLQSALQPMFYTIVLFMLGCILDAVRMNNENNYKTDEEIREALEAKQQAKEAKKLAKGEAAAIAAGNVTTDEASVEADFARSLDAELKADGFSGSDKKAAGKIDFGSGSGSGKGSNSGSGNGGGNRKPRSNNSNRNSSGKSGSNTGRKKPEGGKSDAGKKDSAANKPEGGKNDGGNGNKNDGGKKEGGSGRSGGNGGQRRSSRKPADKPKLEDATKSKAADGFEVVIAEPESKE